MNAGFLPKLSGLGSLLMRATALVAVVAVTGCTSAATDGGGNTPTSAPGEDSGFLLVAAKDQPYGMDALVSGLLDIDSERECVRIVPGDGTLAMPLVFEYGTTLATPELAIVLPDGRRFENQTRVTIEGGGVLAGHLADRAGISHIQIPESCWPDESSDAERYVWIVNPFGWSIEREQ